MDFWLCEISVFLFLKILGEQTFGKAARLICDDLIFQIPGDQEPCKLLKNKKYVLREKNLTRKKVGFFTLKKSKKGLKAKG